MVSTKKRLYLETDMCHNTFCWFWQCSLFFHNCYRKLWVMKVRISFTYYTISIQVEQEKKSLIYSIFLTFKIWFLLCIVCIHAIWNIRTMSWTKSWISNSQLWGKPYFFGCRYCVYTWFEISQTEGAENGSFDWFCTDLEIL